MPENVGGQSAVISAAEEDNAERPKIGEDDRAVECLRLARVYPAKIIHPVSVGEADSDTYAF